MTHISTAFSLPYTEKALGPVMPQERERLRASLFAAAEAALRDRSQTPRSTETTTSEAPHPLLKAACSLCAGRCCEPGLKNNAFINKKKMTALLERFPDADAERLSAHYMEQLPDQHIVDQCLYHTETGCALPREDRSEICNTYLCRTVKAFEKAPSSVKELQDPVLLFSMDFGELKRGAVAQHDTITPLDDTRIEAIKSTLNGQ